MMEVMDIGSVSLIDFAEKAIPTQSAAPKFSGVGALAGLVIGCFLGVLYYFFVPKVRSKSSLESLNLDIISEIPFITNGNTGMNCFLDDKDIPQEYQESYGRLAAVFHYITEQSNNKIIGVTSSISGEGKSTVAYNLALQLSRNGYKVLLLDFDFKKGVLYHLSRARKPRDGDIRIESRNTENLSGLTEKMYNGIYTIQGFSEKDIFHSKNNIFPAIHRLKEQFDYIIIDTPPVGIMSDVLQMGELIEGILLVVREDFVPVGSVEKSIEFLKQSGLSVTGCVLNGGTWG